MNTLFRTVERFLFPAPAFFNKMAWVRGFLAGLSLASGVAGTALAQPPQSAPTRRAAILLPPRPTDPEDLPLVARGAIDDPPFNPVAPYSPTPTPPLGQRLTVPAVSGGPSSGQVWSGNRFDPNIIPAGAAYPATGSQPTPNSTGYPVPGQPQTVDDPSLLSRGYTRIKGFAGADRPTTPTSPAMGQTAAGHGAVDPYAPLQGTAANGSPVLAGPPSWYWYGWGGPAAPPPNAQYPRGSQTWLSVTKATPGAFPVLVQANRNPVMSEPPAYAGGSRPQPQPQPVPVATGGRAIVPTGPVGGMAPSGPLPPGSPTGQIPPTTPFTRPVPTTPVSLPPVPATIDRTTPPIPLPVNLAPTPVSAGPPRLFPGASLVSADAPRPIPMIPSPTLPAAPPTGQETRLAVPPAAPSPQVGIPTLAAPPPMGPTAQFTPPPTQAPAHLPEPDLLTTPAPLPTIPVANPVSSDAGTNHSSVAGHTTGEKVLIVTKPAASVNDPMPLPTITPTPPATSPARPAAAPAVLPILPSAGPLPLPTITAPAAVPIPATDEVRWQTTPEKAIPLPPGTWAPAGSVPRTPAQPASEGAWQPPGASNQAERPLLARGQMPDSNRRTDPTSDLIAGVCQNRARGLDIRWTGSRKLSVCFEAWGEPTARQVVNDICYRGELAPLEIDFCVLVK